MIKDIEDDELPGVDWKYVAKPTGVDVDNEAQGNAHQKHYKIDDLGHQDSTKLVVALTAKPFTASEGVSSPAKRRMMQVVKNPLSQGSKYDKLEASMIMIARRQGAAWMQVVVDVVNRIPEM